MFIPKCRRKVLFVQIRWELGHVFHRLAGQKESRIEEAHVMPDHVHMMSVRNDIIQGPLADSAYRSEEREQRLREKKYDSHIQHKGTRNKPLTAMEQQGNRTRATVRVEHVLGA